MVPSDTFTPAEQVILAAAQDEVDSLHEGRVHWPSEPMYRRARSDAYMRAGARTGVSGLAAMHVHLRAQGFSTTFGEGSRA